MVISRRHLLFCAPAIIAYPKLMPLPRNAFNWDIDDYARSAFGPRDGVALRCSPHPLSNIADNCVDLNEENLLNMMIEISGFDQYGQRVFEHMQQPLRIKPKEVPW